MSYGKLLAVGILLAQGGGAMRQGAAARRQASAFSMVVTADAPVRVETAESLIAMPNKVPNAMFNKAKLKMPLNGIDPVGEGDASKDPEILPVREYEDPLFSYEEFSSQIGGFTKRVSKGQNCTGRVILIQPAGALVDVGTKSNALVPTSEASLTPVDDVALVFELGQSYSFEVISDEDENGQLTLSRKRLMYAEAWQKIEAMHAADGTFDATVLSVNRGGAVVLVEGLRAFLPGSHLVGRTASDEMVGEKVKCKFLDLDKENSRVVVSNKRAVVDEGMKDIDVGQVVEGVVTASKPYGVFVSVNGVAGLLHISQISSDRVHDLDRVVPVGMRLKCLVVSRDASQGRLALSTKTLEATPGEMLRDPDAVYANADANAANYFARIEQERKAREEAAQDVIIGLEAALSGAGADDDAPAE